jgi:apolipoprotein N-acyltransferase
MQANRWSIVWLALAVVLSLFSGGRWVISLAVWLATLFWLRFIRTQKPIRGYLIAAIVGSVPAYFALQGMVPVSPAEYLFIIAISSLIGLLPYLADRVMAQRIQGPASTLVFPLAMTALEYLNSLVQSFGTWGATAYTQVDNLPLIQIASITGIWGITFLIAWFASVVNWAWEQEFEWQKVRGGVLSYAGILALVLLFGGARLALFPPASNTVRVAVLTSSLFDQVWQEVKPVLLPQAGQSVQANWDSVFAQATAVNDDLFKRSEQAAKAGAKIVFWSEASAIVMKDDEAALIERGRQQARQSQIYLGMTLWTFLHRDPSRAPKEKMIENKVVLVDPSGEVAFKYLKTIPVPGAEEALTVRGDGNVPTLATPYGRIAAAICFDADFPHLPRPAGQAGASVIFVPGADWEEITPYHTYMAVFRAVENGFSLVRAARNGLSIAVDYQGRVLAAMDHFKTDDRVMIAHVPVKGAFTLYAQIGDVFAWLSIAGFFAMLGWIVLRRK